MKTDLNNFWHTCSWRNLQQNYMEQMSNLFVEHRYFKFQDEIQFFSMQQRNAETPHFRKLLWLQYAYKLLCPRLASYYLHDTSLLMSWCNITLFTFSLTYLSWRAPNAHCLAADDAFTGFSNNERRRCLSVVQMSAFLHGNEWTSLWTFAVTVRLELIQFRLAD